MVEEREDPLFDILKKREDPCLFIILRWMLGAVGVGCWLLDVVWSPFASGT